MDEIYSIIRSTDSGPMSLNCAFFNEMRNGYNRGYALLFVLDGTMEIRCEDQRFLLKKEDIILVNDGTPYSAKSDDGASVLVLRMNLHSFLVAKHPPRFSCNSSNDPDHTRFRNLKRLLAELVKSNTSFDAADHQYVNLSLMFAILNELQTHFPADVQEKTGNRKQQQRIVELFQYIDEHYQEGLTLKDIASHVGLTVPYLSSFFEKHIGMTFLSYYNELRLAKAMNDLMGTEKSIEDVALSNGFTDPRSFVNAFKKKYGELPSVYRKGFQRGQGRIDYRRARSGGKRFENHLTILAQYLKPVEDSQGERIEGEDTPKKTLVRDNVNVTNVIGSLKHTFKTFTSVGRAKELLYSDVQEMLKELQNDVGFEFIKFHGLLSDDMLVYRENEDGEATYSFVLVDKVIDFLLSIKLKPLIEFSFMPKDLAGPGTHEVYASPFYIGGPKSFAKWGNLIDALMAHLVDRYSARVVRTWLFSVWNEPDTTTSLFGLPNDEDFFRMYKIAYEIVKKYSAQCKVGTPSLIYSYRVYQPWLKKFIKWCLANACRPDFINIHYYDNDFTVSQIDAHRPAHPVHSRLNIDPDSFGKAIVDIKRYFKDLGLEDLPVYMTEWNLTVSHRNLLNDTCFKSCYLAKNLLENYDALNSFGYWVLTDFIEETQPSSQEFHGGLGLFTHNKIKKPHYYTFELLNRLGNSLIEKGPGYFISKRHGCVQVFLYNYEHFNHLFASGEEFDANYLDRYTPFSSFGKMDVSLRLVGFTAKRVHLVSRIVNQKFGSAFDMWASMSAPKMDEELIAYLRRICVPKIDFKDIDAIDGSVEIKALLEPLEIRLIEIRY